MYGTGTHKARPESPVEQVMVWPVATVATEATLLEVADALSAHLTAGEIMTTDVVTLDPHDTVLTAASRMREAGVRHLPVLDEGRIAGMVSIRDALDVLVGREVAENILADGYTGRLLAVARRPVDVPGVEVVSEIEELPAELAGQARS
jgi:CBS domain-containing protein